MTYFNYLVLMPWNNGSNVKETKVHKFESYKEVCTLVANRIQWYYYDAVPFEILLENKDLTGIEVIKSHGHDGMRNMSVEQLLKTVYDKVEWRGDKL